LIWVVGCALLTVAGGCLVPASRVNSCQARYHQLCERNKALQTELANLTAESRKLASERDQSEWELVSLDRRRAESIWAGGYHDLPLPAETADDLRELATRYEGLQYDPEGKVIRLKEASLFLAGTKLKVEAGELLAELGALLNRPAAKDLRILVVAADKPDGGRSEMQENLGRAVSLANFFKSWGIAEQRIGISSYGLAGRNEKRGEPIAGRVGNEGTGIEVFLLAPQIPVVGWK
jgi:hypothetical protein